MKRIISLLMCLVMTCLVFTGCAKSTLDQFKEDRKDYDNLNLKSKREEVELDFYIIFEDGTTESAMATVERDINAYLPTIKLDKDSAELKTTLDIHYLTASEYAAKVANDAELTGADRADIVLIVGKAMFDDLMDNNRLADLTSYYSTRKYGLLNTQIADSLIQASKVSVRSVDTIGTEFDSIRLYTVPNNHVVGEYQYLLINTAIAEHYLFSEDKLAAMDSLESAADLCARIESDGLVAGDYVKLVGGTYADKAMYEAAGYTVNIVSYPVATADEAFMSAFGIIRHELDTRYMYEMDRLKDDKISKENREVFEAHYDRCMEVIYALNADATFRNLLQYGSRGTTYNYDETTKTVTRVTEGDGVYRINLYYTGDIFKAYFCEEFAWNKDAFENGEKQNVQSVAPTK